MFAVIMVVCVSCGAEGQPKMAVRAVLVMLMHPDAMAVRNFVMHPPMMSAS